MASDSSEDDIQHHDMYPSAILAQPEKLGQLVNSETLVQELGFGSNLPHRWLEAIENNEIDMETSKNVCNEFGPIGVLLYSSL